jgi:predicted SAM-dependent methyltransferase
MRFAKRFAAPLTRRLHQRVEQQVVAGTSAVQTRLLEINHALVHDIAALREELHQVGHHIYIDHGTLQQIERHLPTLLNTITSQNATGRLHQRRLDGVDSRFAAVEAAMCALEAATSSATATAEGAVAALREQIAALDDIARYSDVAKAISEAAEVLHARVADTEHRLEFIRREVLYELRYRTPDAASPVSTPTPPILEPGAPVLLNLGAGHGPRDGWINVDVRDLDGIELRSDVRFLPFEPGTVDAIHAAHLLEHFPEEELRRVVLPHWRRLLVAGGRLEIVVPDADAMLAAHAAGAMSFDDLRLVTFGEQEYEGDFHHTMFSRASLTELLTSAGFTEVELVQAARPNGLCLEMELHARTPAGA